MSTPTKITATRTAPTNIFLELRGAARRVGTSFADLAELLANQQRALTSLSNRQLAQATVTQEMHEASDALTSRLDREVERLRRLENTTDRLYKVLSVIITITLVCTLYSLLFNKEG